MEHQKSLRSFEYSILDADKATPGIGFRLPQKAKSPDRSPLLSLRIDFEQGNFFLDGNWEYLLAANSTIGQVWNRRQRERVKIKTDLFPCVKLDLADPKNEGFYFTMQGAVQDDDYKSTCSGLLIMEKIRWEDGGYTDDWMLTFYLFDMSKNECEIKLLLPVLLDPVNETLN